MPAAFQAQCNRDGGVLCNVRVRTFCFLLGDKFVAVNFVVNVAVPRTFFWFAFPH